MHSNQPLLLVGHGTRDLQGKQTFLDFAHAYQHHDTSRPVVPCFLELTDPSIQDGIDALVAQGHNEMTVVPLLLFAARHNKFDVTNALDAARLHHPDLKLHYGAHLGITPDLIDLWQARLAALDAASDVPRSETLLLFVGRGSSDPDANGDACKMARMLWEGSGFMGVEICFIGITHPRLDQGFARAWTWGARRVIVLPYFLFTGVLVKRIQETAEEQGRLHPEVQVQAMAEIGLDPVLFELLQRREVEARTGQVAMNCELCKFRRAFQMPGQVHAGHDHGGHSHGHDHAHVPVQAAHDHAGHSHAGHDHGHSHGAEDRYAQIEDYHSLIWQAP